MNHSTYEHTQYGPWCGLVAITGVAMLAVTPTVLGMPPLALTLGVTGCAMLILALSICWLRVKDLGDRLEVRFGPLPLFVRTMKYADIRKVEVDRSTWIDGWGIHLSSRGGWLWNIWGWDCVVLHTQGSVWRIGSDEAQGLADYLKSRVN